MTLAIAIFLPLVAGALLPLIKMGQKGRTAYVLSATILCSLLVGLVLLQPSQRLHLLRLGSAGLRISFRVDGLSTIFASLLAVLWPVTTLYAVTYMKGENKQRSFFSFFLMSYGATLGIAFSDNLLTLYLFYELMTFSTLPLVMQGGSTKSVKAGLKYLYYSLGGSAFAFIGLVYLFYFGGTTTFIQGGLFKNIELARSSQLRVGYLLCFLGFSVKASVFPLHGWLPSAAVAPTPVTALLHAVAVVKSGVFAIIRVTYFSFGIAVIQGSFAQYVPLGLATFTLVFGCAMALKEEHLKRRLAYSTVSNLSYIVFGVMLLSPQGLSAGLLHMIYHALMKITLFLIVGIWNIRADAIYIQHIRGLGKRLPLLAWLFVIGSLAMVGMPPLIGFISKWALLQAGLAQASTLAIIGTVCLLISAILTAIYLLVPSVTLFAGKLQGGEGTGLAVATAPKVEPSFTWTVAGLTLAMLLIGLFNQPLMDYLARIASSAV